MLKNSKKNGTVEFVLVTSAHDPAVAACKTVNCQILQSSRAQAQHFVEKNIL